MPKNQMPFVLLVLLSLFAESLAHAGQEETINRQIKDAQEVGDVAPKQGRWVPVPIPVSNPTVGTGLQGVLMYLHPARKEDTQSPNSTSGLAGMYTDSKSWAAALFHDGYWADDTYRFRGILGYGEFNLKFYGIGDSPVFGNNPLDYEFSGWAFMPKFQRRIPKTDHWFGGVHYLFIEADVLINTSKVSSILPDVGRNVRTAGLGLLASYDSRDDNYYPSQGISFESKWGNYSENWGGDFEYDKLNTFFNYYHPIKDKSVLALRANLQNSDGRVPFFDLPYLDMRGFSRDRYRDKHTFSLHAEGRHKFKPRWGAVAFIEVGWFGNSIEDMSTNPTIFSYGGGVRWQVTKDKKLNLGVDVAFSTDDNSIYIQVGEKF